MAALVHVEAVCGKDAPADAVHWARPSTVMWTSDEVFIRMDDDSRRSYRDAASRGSKQVDELHQAWGVPYQPVYKENSRETLRDETFRGWREHGALQMRPGIPTSSSAPRWALSEEFADLFDPDLEEEAFRKAAEQWRETHMDPGARLKAAFALDAETAKHAVIVDLPDGTKRTLENSNSSLIIKGVVESWAPARMGKPVVLAISEPGVKVHMGDERMLQILKIKIDVNNVLPDVLMADIGADPVQFWIVEAVATDGPVSAERKKALLAWAARQNIKADRCSFLTAFLSRNADAARRRLKDLASGTWAWYADEPGHELAWYSLTPSADDL
ncbi:hypothetical protein Cci01nite_72000 [Catellatospora citrea]|uniref:BsuBI/PstI restriction endonuclease n=1 Tax=Catellatospora citrea TaxID=53366 RepID=A0A8J3KLQ0_9ACTN|nr:hypothetical protein Cci01nite_72000 [Catellatospora citrea]